MKEKRTALWCYMPVIHGGYLRWIESHPEAVVLGIVGQNNIDSERSLVKDIRRAQPSVIARMMETAFSGRVQVVDDLDGMHKYCINTNCKRIIAPDEPIMRRLAAGIHPTFKMEIIFEPVFLRWHHDNVLLAQPGDWPTIGRGEFEQTIWSDLDRQSQLSADWWRQVASCVVRDGEVVISAINRPVPSDQTVNFQGDPRALFKKGIHLELSSFMHAEASVIGQAARHGLSLEGCDMYVTTFPCPPCAKLITEAGLRRVIYRDGYAVLDGADVLKSAGVAIECFDDHA